VNSFSLPDNKLPFSTRRGMLCQLSAVGNRDDGGLCVGSGTAETTRG